MAGKRGPEQLLSPGPTDPKRHKENITQEAAPVQVSLALVDLTADQSSRKFMDQARKVLFDSIACFLGETSDKPWLRVVLVEAEDSPDIKSIQEHLTHHAELSKGHSDRFVFFAGDVTRLNSAGYACQIIAIPCNWRLMGRGGKINVNVHKAAGPELENKARLQYGKAVVGHSYPVHLTGKGSLQTEEGVQYVVNMLPPSPEEQQEVDGFAETLSLSYKTLFTSMLPLAKEIYEKMPVSAARPSLRKVSNEQAVIGEGEEEESVKVTMGEPIHYKHPGTPPPKVSNWKDVLKIYLRKEIPVAQKEYIYFEDENCVVIYDGYPKAKIHLLVLPKPSFLDISSIVQLRAEHFQKIKLLHKIGSTIASWLKDQVSDRIELGYHSLPSLAPLHLHIISQDFDSVCLNKKKHYNSFATELFVKAERLEKEIQTYGKIKLKDHEELWRIENQEPVCHRCGQAKGWKMPDFKRHIAQCRGSQC